MTSLQQPAPANDPADDWLANLADITTDAELVAIATKTATANRTTKPHKPKRIAGETHTFRPIPIMKQHAPRQSPFYGTNPVYRSYQISQLAKAHYNPSHLLGMEPLMSFFGHLHMSHGDWL